MSADQTEIHDTHTCPCEMCVWARETAANKPKSPSETYYGYPRLDTGLKIDSSGPSASEIAISMPTFEREWQDAPRWATNYTEQQIAHYWFIRGQHAKEVELLAGMNHDLREMIRVARERTGK